MNGTKIERNKINFNSKETLLKVNEYFDLYNAPMSKIERDIIIMDVIQCVRKGSELGLALKFNSIAHTYHNAVARASTTNFSPLDHTYKKMVDSYKDAFSAIGLAMDKSMKSYRCMKKREGIQTLGDVARRCLVITNSGYRCTRKIKAGKDKCSQHLRGKQMHNKRKYLKEYYAETKLCP